MQRSKFSAEQVVQILEECKISSPKEVSRKYGVSDKTIWGWKKKFGGMQSDEVRRLRQLEDENSTLDNLCLKEINAKKW
jgi:putative transposase